MRFLKTNTAVIVTVGPFYDKTDGVTIETALTITNERITLVKDANDGTAPTLILDNIVGATSATENDLNYIANNDAGLMQLELSAANLNFLGRLFLSITDAVNHVPVFHEFMVVSAQMWNAMFGTGNLPADVVNWKGSAAPAMTGDAFERLGAPAGASLAADTAAVKTDTAAIKAKTDNLPADPAGMAALVAAHGIGSWQSEGGAGAVSQTFRVKDTDGNLVDGAEVWVTSDPAGANVVAGTIHSNAGGLVTFMLDSGTYYVWAQRAGVNFTNPMPVTV